MKVTIVSNGSLQVIATPENELEKLVLQSLSGSPVELTMHPTLQIGDKQLVDSVIIQAVKPPKMPTV